MAVRCLDCGGTVDMVQNETTEEVLCRGCGKYWKTTLNGGD